MRKFIIFLITLLCVSCCPCRHLPQVINNETKIVEKIVEKIDTVVVELPKETIEVIRQDSSYLENNVAVSFAKVDDAGLLHHTLSTKKDIQVKVQVKEVEVIKEVETVKEVPYEVEVVKTKYPKLFWIMLVMLIGIVGWRIFKLFRYIV